MVTLATNLPTVGISPWCCSACPATVSATTDAGPPDCQNASLGVSGPQAAIADRT